MPFFKLCIIAAAAWLVVGAPCAFAYQLAQGDVVGGLACALGLIGSAALIVWEVSR